MTDFGSDNHSGVHSEVLKAIQKANFGHCTAYGEDRWTEKAESLFKKEFGEDTAVFFTLTGTGSNSIALKSVTDSYNAIICAENSHINVDECGAPEKFTGCKLLPLQDENGKITVSKIEDIFFERLDEHQSQPKVVSITQSTELGTVYTVDEIKKITDYAHRKNIFVHMDGARIANAAVSLGKTFRSFTRDAGVDILSFGGTKNGLLCGEAVIFFNPENAGTVKFFRKQGAQLFSKMRFISSQFIPYFSQNLWKINAEHSNNMALLLANEISGIRGVSVTRPVESNAVFAVLPKERIEDIRKKFFFHIWNKRSGEVRFMTSFDTSEKDILSLSEYISQIV